MKNLALFILLFVSFAISQDVKVDTLEDVESQLFENVEIDSDVSEIFEQFEFTRIELNRTTIEDLTEIPFITKDVAVKIISYRDKLGGFKSREQVLEIQDVDDFVKYFLYRNGYIHKPRLKLNVRTRALNKGNLRSFGKNFDENFKTYQLVSSSFSNFSAGFVIEKDYGERKINDMLHFCIDYKGLRFLRKFVVGNYTLMFGQGILMWRPVSLGKGSDAVSPAIRNTENYISSYISTDEVKPLFGGAVATKVGSFDVSLFYSKTKLPSSVDTNGFVRYIDFSGISTTSRFALSRDLVGGILGIGRPNFSIGVIAYYEKFDKNFSPSISRPFGRDKFYQSFEYSLYFGNLIFSGEIASARFSNFSVVSGLSITFKSLDIVFQYRNLNPNLVSINGNVFGERYGEAWNEEGFYSGVKFKYGAFVFSGYYDVFKFPLVNFDDVKNGVDYRVEVKFRLSRNSVVKLLRREKSTVEGIKIYDEFGRANFSGAVERRESWRLDVENKFKGIEFRSRIEVVKRKLNNVESGFLIYQGVKFEIFKSLKFYGRVSFFRSDSYWSRIYVYEDDIDGVVSLIPLYGEGLRWYFVAKYKYGEIFYFQVKYGETFFANDLKVKSIFGVQVGVKI